MQNRIRRRQARRGKIGPVSTTDLRYLPVSAVGRRLSPHQSSGAPSRAHIYCVPNTITIDFGTFSNQPHRRLCKWTACTTRCRPCCVAPMPARSSAYAWPTNFRRVAAVPTHNKSGCDRACMSRSTGSTKIAYNASALRPSHIFACIYAQGEHRSLVVSTRASRQTHVSIGHSAPAHRGGHGHNGGTTS